MRKLQSAIFFSALAVLLAGCGSDIQEQYVDSCLAGAGNSSQAEEICSCTYEKLEAQFGEERLEKWLTEVVPSNQEDAEKFANGAINAMAQCVGKR